MTLISDPENTDFCEECPHSLDIHCDRCDSLDSNFRDILKRIDDLVINDETRTRINLENKGRFPFDQKFRKFRVWERLEQTFSGISFPNFGCTSRGWPKIPENRNNRKIPFHSTIPARAQFLRARKSNSTWLPILLLNISVPLVIMRQMT